MIVPIDYSTLKNEHLPNYTEIYENNISFIGNITKWVENSIYLSSPFQIKLLITYALVPSALCNCLPLLILYGPKGCGKSTALELISYLWDIPINSSADTFSAIRNDLNNRRWKETKLIDENGEEGKFVQKIELNTMMLWDDLDPNVFTEQPNLYRMLKCGYKKATDLISIAGARGKNVTFNSFSPKILSTIKPIWGHPKYTEIERRSLVIKFKKATKTEDIPPLRLSDYNWNGLSKRINSLWNKKRALNWLGYRSLLINTLANNSRNEITLDLMATGMALKIFKDIDDAISYFESYWQWYDDNLATGDSALCGLLKDFIKENLEQNKKYQLNYHSDNPDLEEKIDPGVLRKKVDIWYSCGMLEDKPKAKLISEVMNYLGWQLVPGKWIKF